MKAIGIFKWVGLLAGGAMLGGALLLGQHTRAFVARAQHASGEVVELVPHRSSDSTTYAPAVRFVAADGQTIRFVASFSSSPPAFAVGERVDVLYPAGQPDQAKINAFFSLWGGAVILGGIGAVFLAVGLALQLAARLARRREQDLLLHGTPVMADFQSVDRNTRLEVNGRHPYRVTAQWRNPATGKVHVFQSRNLWYDPTPYLERRQLTVYLDTANPKRYHMDTSFLPQQAG
ncbi:MAG TPA: DUF3592 domain-containing protein [Nevskia sp.]|nr:DUF3592 domain-containing protein [Nevskia sp.]